MHDTYIQYDVLTEEEALGLLPKGNYPATIKFAETKISSKDPSKSYVVLTVVVHDKRDHEFKTWCALPYMLKHAADSTGNEEKYKTKQLKLSDFSNKKCIARVKIQEGTDKYPTTKNVIWDFLKPETNQVNQIPFDDAVPF